MNVDQKHTEYNYAKKKPETFYSPTQFRKAFYEI